MTDHIDVFISSTARDLEPYREKVKQAVMRLGMYPIAMEEFTPSERNALQKCYDEVQNAEIFVGIYAHRYGYAPSADVIYKTQSGEIRFGDGLTGITEWEYHWALERGIPLFLFILHETEGDGKSLVWPSEFIEGDPGKTRLANFKAHIKLKHTVGFFRAPDDLALQVATTVAPFIKRGADEHGWRALQSPLPPPYFGGRSEDIGKIRALLAEPPHRVAIQGVGGAGKTALAKFLGRELAEHYPGGVLWAYLGPQARSPELTLPLVFAEWRQASPAGRSANQEDLTAANMKSWLKDAPSPLLAIIDDAWRPETLRALLDALPDDCAVIWTTRDAGLITPRTGRRYALTHLAPPDAVAMLSRRIGADDAWNDDFKRISELLGYHALALELAAAYLETHTVHDAPKLITRLQRHFGGDNPFKELNLGEDRDENLEAALRLSYNPLPDEHKRGFRLLGAIPSGLDFSQEMAFTIWGHDSADDEETLEAAEDRLAALTRAALLDRTNDGRYVLHGNLHAYAVALMKRLQREAETDKDELSDAQTRYYARVNKIAALFAQLKPENWKAQIDPELPHIHRRGDDLVTMFNATPEPEAGLTEEALAFAALIPPYLRIRREVHRPEWLKMGLDAARRMPDPKYEARFLSELGIYHNAIGQKQQALDELSAALEIWRALGDRLGEGEALNYLGEVLAEMAEPEKALEYFQQAILLRQGSEDRAGESETLNNLGKMHSDRGEYEQAQDYFAQSLAIKRALGDRQGEAQTLINIGLIYQRTEDYPRSLDYQEQGLVLARAVGDRASEGFALNNMAAVYYKQGNGEHAFETFKEVLQVMREIGSVLHEAGFTLNAAVVLYRLLGRSQEALEYGERALALLDKTGLPQDMGGITRERYVGFLELVKKALNESMDGV